MLKFLVCFGYLLLVSFVSDSAAKEPNDLIHLQRFYDSANDQHLYSVSSNEATAFKQRPGFQEQQVIGRVSSKPVQGTTRLWRAVFDNNTRYSYYTGPEDATPENALDKSGFEAYVWIEPGDGRIPVYYNARKDGTDQFYSHVLDQVRGYAKSSPSAKRRLRVAFEDNAIAFWVYPPIVQTIVSEAVVDSSQAMSKTPKAGERDAPSTKQPSTGKEEILDDSKLVQFQELMLDAEVTDLQLTSDGKYLLVAHQSINTVSVVDVVSQRSVHKILTPSPRSIVCRGDAIYIANYGSGTISVFSIAGDWKQTNELRVPKLNIVYISMSQGPSNSNLLLATCHGEGVEGSYKDCQNYAIEVTSDRSREISQRSLILASKDGRSVVSVESFGLSSAGTLQVYDFNAFIKDERSAKHRVWRDVGDKTFAREAFLAGFWISPSSVFAGETLEPLESSQSAMQIPDYSQPIVYTVDSKFIRARRLDGTLGEIGKRNIKLPNEAGSFASMTSWLTRTRKYLLDLPVAVTHGNRLHLFFTSAETGRLMSAETEAFALPSETLKSMGNSGLADASMDNDSGNAMKSDNESIFADASQTPKTALDQQYQNGFPAWVAAGSTVQYQFRVQNGAKLQLMNAIPGASLTPDGRFNWAVSPESLGFVDLKLRIESNGSYQFARLSSEVVERELFSELRGNLASWDTHQRVACGKEVTNIRLSSDRKQLLILCGNRVVLLSPDGSRKIKDITLKNKYEFVDIRGPHLIAVSKDSMDAFRLSDLVQEASVDLRQFRLPIKKVTDLTLHPTSRQAFVCIELRNMVPRYQLLRFDESKSVVNDHDLPAKWTAVSPDGKMLFAGYSEIIDAGQSLHWHPRGVEIVNHYGTIDLLYRVQLANQLNVEQVVPKPGVNGRGVRLSSGGQRVVYLSTRGDANLANSVVAWDGRDFDAQKAIFSLSDDCQPDKLCFHPKKSVAAIPTKGSAVLYSAVDGTRLQSGLLIPRSGIGPHEILDMQFSPDGNHLVLLCKAGEEYFTKSITIKWSSGDTLADEEVIRYLHREIVKSKPIPRGLLTSLKIPPKTGESLTPRTIGRKSLPSVVSISTDGGIGTGFFVGQTGYVLTNEHVIRSAKQIQIRFQDENGKEQTAIAQVIRSDPKKDLAILKADINRNVLAVEISIRPQTEIGEPVTVIGSPGLGSAVLDQSMTTGIVSNPRREIDGEMFIQTDAPVNPGSSGSPMFDEFGQVIGLVTLKGNIEGAGFAVPAIVLRDFLETSQEESPVRTETVKYRTFKDKTGKFSVEASVEDVDDDKGTVSLRKKDGQVIAVPMDRLDIEDQEFLKSFSLSTSK